MSEIESIDSVDSSPPPPPPPPVETASPADTSSSQGGDAKGADEASSPSDVWGSDGYSESDAAADEGSGAYDSELDTNHDGIVDKFEWAKAEAEEKRDKANEAISGLAESKREQGIAQEGSGKDDAVKGVGDAARSKDGRTDPVASKADAAKASSRRGDDEGASRSAAEAAGGDDDAEAAQTRVDREKARVDADDAGTAADAARQDATRAQEQAEKAAGEAEKPAEKARAEAAQEAEKAQKTAETDKAQEAEKAQKTAETDPAQKARDTAGSRQEPPPAQPPAEQAEHLRALQANFLPPAASQAGAPAAVQPPAASAPAAATPPAEGPSAASPARPVAEPQPPAAVSPSVSAASGQPLDASTPGPAVDAASPSSSSAADAATLPSQAAPSADAATLPSQAAPSTAPPLPVSSAASSTATPSAAAGVDATPASTAAAPQASSPAPPQQGAGPTAEVDRARADARAVASEAETVRSDAERARATSQASRENASDAGQSRTDAEKAKNDAERSRADADRVRADAERSRAQTEAANAQAAAQAAPPPPAPPAAPAAPAAGSPAVRSIDSSRVADPAQAQALAARVNEVTRNAGNLGVNVVLVDPQNREAFLRERGGVGAHRDQHGHEQGDQVGLYLGRTNEVMLSTEVLRMNPQQQNEVIRHEFRHAEQMQQIQSRGPDGHNVPYMHQMGAAWREARQSEASRDSLRQGFERIGYAPHEAREKSEHAMDNPLEYDAAYRSLHDTDPSNREALARANPRMGEVARREDAGQALPSNREFFRDMDHGRFNHTHGWHGRDADDVRRSREDRQAQDHVRDHLASQYDMRADTRASGTRSDMQVPPGVDRIGGANRGPSADHGDFRGSWGRERFETGPYMGSTSRPPIQPPSDRAPGQPGTDRSRGVETYAQNTPPRGSTPDVQPASYRPDGDRSPAQPASYRPEGDRSPAQPASYRPDGDRSLTQPASYRPDGDRSLTQPASYRPEGDRSPAPSRSVTQPPPAPAAPQPPSADRPMAKEAPGRPEVGAWNTGRQTVTPDGVQKVPATPPSAATPEQAGSAIPRAQFTTSGADKTTPAPAAQAPPPAAQSAQVRPDAGAASRAQQQAPAGVQASVGRQDGPAVAPQSNAPHPAGQANPGTAPAGQASPAPAAAPAGQAPAGARPQPQPSQPAAPAQVAPAQAPPPSAARPAVQAPPAAPAQPAPAQAPPPSAARPAVQAPPAAPAQPAPAQAPPPSAARPAMQPPAAPAQATPAQATPPSAARPTAQPQQPVAPGTSAAPSPNRPVSGEYIASQRPLGPQPAGAPDSRQPVAPPPAAPGRTVDAPTRNDVPRPADAAPRATDARPTAPPPAPSAVRPDAAPRGSADFLPGQQQRPAPLAGEPRPASPQPGQGTQAQPGQGPQTQPGPAARPAGAATSGPVQPGQAPSQNAQPARPAGAAAATPGTPAEAPRGAPDPSRQAPQQPAAQAPQQARPSPQQQSQPQQPQQPAQPAQRAGAPAQQPASQPQQPASQPQQQQRPEQARPPEQKPGEPKDPKAQPKGDGKGDPRAQGQVAPVDPNAAVQGEAGREVVANVNHAELKALEGQIPQLVARGVLSKADANALQQYIKNGRLPETDAGRAALQKALNTVETLRDAGHDLADLARTPAARGARGGPVAEQFGGRSVDDVILKASGSSLHHADFEFLAHASSSREGGQNLADALEWMMTQPNGAHRMMDLLAQASRPENTTYMAQTLARMAQASPEQTLGMLLLTTDHAGGTRELVRFFGAMGDKQQAATHFASLFERLTKSPQAAGSMAELLDLLTAPSTEERSGSRVMARLFSEGSAQAKGATSLNAGFGKTLETEGGARAFARILNRLTTSAEGSQDTGSFLKNLGNQESGSEAVGRLLTRAAASRDGARQVMDSFSRIAGADGGDKRAGEVLSRVFESQSGARFLSNMTTDAQSGRALEGLLERLDNASPELSKRLTTAFEKLASQPEMASLRQRSSESAESIINRFVTERAEQAQVRTDAQEGPHPLLRNAVFTLGQVGAEELRVAVQQPGAEPAQADPKAALAAPSEAHAEGGPSVPQSETSRQAATETAAASRTAPSGREVGRAGALDDVPAEQRSGRQSQMVQGTGQQQGKGGEAGGFMMSMQGQKQTRKSSAVEAVGDVEETHEGEASSSKATSRFRPGDVYSKSTLLAARICGECGFRLTPSGRCMRCEEHAYRDMVAAQAQAVRPI